MAADRHCGVSFESLENEIAPVRSLIFQLEKRELLYQALTCVWTEP